MSSQRIGHTSSVSGSICGSRHAHSWRRVFGCSDIRIRRCVRPRRQSRTQRRVLVLWLPRRMTAFTACTSASVASGWSGRRVGLAPTGKAPPCHGAHGERAFADRRRFADDIGNAQRDRWRRSDRRDYYTSDELWPHRSEDGHRLFQRSRGAAQSALSDARTCACVCSRHEELAREAGEAQPLGNADRPHVHRPCW
jgi:hypothetical protein